MTPSQSERRSGPTTQRAQSERELRRRYYQLTREGWPWPVSWFKARRIARRDWQRYG